MHSYVCICVSMCAYVYVHLCVYIHALYMYVCMSDCLGQGLVGLRNCVLPRFWVSGIVSCKENAPGNYSITHTCTQHTWTRNAPTHLWI